jgi:non-specific serine/threonine protein kinase
MTSESNWKQIEALFEASLERPASERAAWLKSACRFDPALRREVEQMLGAHDRAEGILEEPLGSLAAGVLEEADLEPIREGRVGPYRLLEEIGRGGMGVVYRARDDRLARDVAVKFLPPHLRADAEVKERFLAEARAASRLDHPNICTVYDLGEADDGRLFLVMACYEGRTLAEKLAEGRLPVDEALDLTTQIARGLARAHEAGIVHRDIKPANVMVTVRGEAKILDFGVAKLEGMAVTRPGGRVGTVAYMAPEQIRGEEVDSRADLWSLGVLLFEMVTGRQAFPGEREASVLHAVLYQPLPSLIDAPVEAPADLEVIQKKLLARRPEERYRSAAELLAALEAIRGIRPAAPRRERASGPIGSGNLPHLLTSFVGRDREIEQIRDLLSTAPLVTLTGPAGTGKTRLSLRVATELAPNYPNGAFFVRLAPITDPALVPEAIAQALEVREIVGREVLDGVAEVLQGRRVLLLLDNFEQVMAAAPMVGDLLARCSGLKALVTSRVLLRISGEQAFPVPPLDLPARSEKASADTLSRFSATALFLERARAASPDFELTDDNAAAVAEICARVDGLPLAIELAAARIRLFPPQVLSSRLGRRLDLLRAGPRDRPHRHQTLRQAIAWSYDLLDDGEQILFRRSAVFVGGMSLEAVEAVVPAIGGLETDLVEGLAALVDHSLIRLTAGEGATPRYVMFETIREYALERLEEAGEAEATQRAHAEYFLARAELAEPELTGPNQGAWLDRLQAEHDDLRAALDWMVENDAADRGLRLGSALWRFWLSRGHVKEGRRRLEALLSAPGAGRRVGARARALHGGGTLAHNDGDSLAARPLLEESLEICRELGDLGGIAAGLNNLAWVACELSDVPGARPLAEEALELNRKLGDRRGEAVALNNLAWAALYGGECVKASELFAQSLAARRRAEDPRGVAFALSCLAMVRDLCGAYEEARRLLDEARELASEVGDKVLLALARINQGSLALHLGDLSVAESLLTEGLPLAREGGNRSLVCWAHTELGKVLTAAGEEEGALRHLEIGLEIWREISTPWGEARTLHALAGLEALRGSWSKAARLELESLGIRRRIADRLGIVECLEGLASIAIEQPDGKLAARLIAAATTQRETLGTPLQPRLQADREWLLETCRESLGDEAFGAETSRGREDSLEQAIALATESGLGRVRG